MCDQWFWAEDDEGDNLPFTPIFGLWIWTGKDYDFVGQYQVPRYGLRLQLQGGITYKYIALLPARYSDDWTRPRDSAFRACAKDIKFVYERIVVYVPELTFSNVAVSRRYGDRLYLSGRIEDITPTDEICIYYRRPGADGIRTLKSDTSEYLYFKGTSGSYDLGANARYLEFGRAGYHWLQAWDVSGSCETPLVQRASWLINIILPRFQYQIIFDLKDPDLGDNAWRLEAEYAKFEAAGSWFVHHEYPDCFPTIQPINTPHDDTRRSGWLSLGAEFGTSPCHPLPYYLCPFPTPKTQYWRGECNCPEFLNTLQPLGIPCSHLIAALKWYSGKTPYSQYVNCP